MNVDSYETEFIYFYPDSSYYIGVDEGISGVAANSAGRKIVVGKLHHLHCHNPAKLTACGISSFVDAVRTITLKAMSPSGSIEFVESEYRLSRDKTPRENGKETLPVAEKSRARSMKISKPRVTFA